MFFFFIADFKKQFHKIFILNLTWMDGNRDWTE